MTVYLMKSLQTIQYKPRTYATLANFNDVKPELHPPARAHQITGGSRNSIVSQCIEVPSVRALTLIHLHVFRCHSAPYVHVHARACACFSCSWCSLLSPHLHCCTSISPHTQTHTHTHMHTHTCTHIQTHTHSRTHLHTHTSKHTYYTYTLPTTDHASQGLGQLQGAHEDDDPRHQRQHADRR